MKNSVILPDGWPRPRGYSNAMSGCGRLIALGGQIGWDKDEKFQELSFIGQWRQTLQNIVAVLEAASATPEHLIQLTVYVTDMSAYRSSLKEAGEVWRDTLGRCFPSMALVGVTELVEPEALVEISGFALIPEQVMS